MDYPYIDAHTHGEGDGIRLRAYSFADADVSGRFERRPYSIGIHPWQAADPRAGLWMEALNSEPCSAIGEIGLDGVCKVDMDVQRAIFIGQIDTACRRGLPVVLHVVRTFEPVMDILKAYRLRCVVLHGFVGSVQQIRRVLDRGYLVSIGPRSLGSEKTVEALRGADLDSVLMETDDSGVPVETVYRRAAEAIGVSEERLKMAVDRNYRRLIYA